LGPPRRTALVQVDGESMRFLPNVIWLILAGLPLGLASFRLIPVSLLPFGREIVSI